jgi:hypothetical protein
MASNIPSGDWSVKIISLPASITINQLAETFQLPLSRIYIPKIQKTTTYFAWINHFTSEKDAKDFVDQWSGSSVFGTVIKCTVKEQKDGDAHVYHTRGNISVSHVKTQQDKTADTQFKFDSNSGLKKMQSNLSSSSTYVPLIILHCYVKKYCKYLLYY